MREKKSNCEICGKALIYATKPEERSVKLSICETLDFLKEKFDIELKYTYSKCIFSEFNDKCEKEKCPIF